MARVALVTGGSRGIGAAISTALKAAAGIAAGAHAQGRVATVAIDAMPSLRPVRIGDVLYIGTTIERVGRTPMSIRLEAWALRDRMGRYEKTPGGLGHLRCARRPRSTAGPCRWSRPDLQEEALAGERTTAGYTMGLVVHRTAHLVTYCPR
jgi:acyl-CoA thioesterase YciA